MKKILLFTLLVFAAGTVLLAQEYPAFKFSVGAELAIASGTFSNFSSFGIGATGQAEIRLKERLFGTATSGILFYNGKSAGNNTKQTGPTIIPVRVGSKSFLACGVYAGAQLGIAFISNNAQFNGTSFAYSPLMLGYEFKTRTDRSIDAGIKYDAYSGSGGGTIGNIGVRVAYIF